MQARTRTHKWIHCLRPPPSKPSKPWSKHPSLLSRASAWPPFPSFLGGGVAVKPPTGGGSSALVRAFHYWTVSLGVRWRWGGASHLVSHLWGAGACSHCWLILIIDNSRRCMVFTWPPGQWGHPSLVGAPPGAHALSARPYVTSGL